MLTLDAVQQALAQLQEFDGMQRRVPNPVEEEARHILRAHTAAARALTAPCMRLLGILLHGEALSYETAFTTGKKTDPAARTASASYISTLRTSGLVSVVHRPKHGAKVWLRPYGLHLYALRVKIDECKTPQT